jgi:hypothetical protein
MAGKYFQPSLTFRVGHCNVTHLVIIDNEKNILTAANDLAYFTRRKEKVRPRILWCHGAPYRCSTLGWAPGLSLEHYNNDGLQGINTLAYFVSS